MAKTSSAPIGKLPRLYSFILNPHTGLRCTTCPKCERKTSLRKFPLCIMVEGMGPLIHGKICRYCATCELIICHQDELEREMAAAIGPRKPEALGNAYVVVGTFDRKAYRKGLKGESLQGNPFEHLTKFKEYLELGYQPAGWYRDDPLQ